MTRLIDVKGALENIRYDRDGEFSFLLRDDFFPVERRGVQAYGMRRKRNGGESTRARRTAASWHRGAYFVGFSGKEARTADSESQKDFLH